MNCAEYQEWVSADIDGVASTPEEAIRRHLEGCLSCRGLRAKTAAVRSLLRSRPPTEVAPPGLRTRILADIDDEAERARAGSVWTLWLPRVSGAAAAVAIVLALVLLAKQPQGLALDDYRLALSSPTALTTDLSTSAELERFYARQEPSLPAHVVDLSEAGFRPRGAILRSGGDRYLRLSVYDDGVHVIICDFRDLAAFSGPVPVGDAALFTSRDGLNLCIRRVGNHICILATRMPMDLFKARMAVYMTG